MVRGHRRIFGRTRKPRLTTGRAPWSLSPSVRLLYTPGHTDEDLSTIVDTDDGLVVCTHAWWTAQGPAVDRYAPSQEVLSASRSRLLDLAPALVVPGHGAAFTPDAGTPR